MAIAICVGAVGICWSAGIALIVSALRQETRYREAPSDTITMTTDTEGLI